MLIDLPRDSVGKGKHTYTTIQGKKTAIVMFFNGMSRTKSGAIPYLYNPNLQGNLAFSLQMKCTAMEYYEGFTKPIYLKGYRYNLHLEPRSLLIELGNENNTVEEAKNAAAPLADVLDKVLSQSFLGLTKYTKEFIMKKNRKKPCNLVLCRFASKKVVQRALLFGRIETKEEKNYGSRTK